jgi:hypothetical protein
MQREKFVAYLPTHTDGAAFIILVSSVNAVCYNMVGPAALTCVQFSQHWFILPPKPWHALRFNPQIYTQARPPPPPLLPLHRCTV